MRSKLLHQVQPIYPQEARAKQIEGKVEMQIVVGTDGTVKQIEILSGDAILTSAAAEAVRHWRYEVTRLNDIPVEVVTKIEVEFHLGGGTPRVAVS
jgi:TonB family protein